MSKRDVTCFDWRSTIAAWVPPVATTATRAAAAEGSASSAQEHSNSEKTGGLTLGTVANVARFAAGPRLGCDLMTTVIRTAIALCALGPVLLAGCGSSDNTVSGEAPNPPQTIELKSSFANGGSLPSKFTCDGRGVSPALSWKGAPGKTKQYALLVEDPDASGGTYVHWSLIDISAAVRSIAQGTTPVGSEQGANSAGRNDYAPPCPPEGDEPHRYVFNIYALDQSIQLGQGAAPEIVRQGVRERAIAGGQLTATYSR